MGVKGRRIYTEQFKSDAVKLATEGQKAVRQVARDLDLEPGTLHTWIRQRGKRAGDVVSSKTETLEEEVRRLRRDVAALTDERDFLKKATAYFAREKK